MSQDTLFYKLTEELNLGTLTGQPTRVTGGFMHKMYKLETTTGTYAVKLLNPTIMKRPEALGNYQRAEQLEAILQKK